jgi:ATP-dependent Zn protease
VSITRVSIVSADYSDGHTSYDSTSALFTGPLSRENFLDELCVALAGRVAEQRKYGYDELDEGAQSDITAATKLAWAAITKFGLDFEFGPVDLAALSREAASSTGWLFDQAQRRLQQVLKDSLLRTETLMRDHWASVEAVALALFEKKTLTDDEVISIMRAAAKSAG